ncbi:hypothetical protein M5K25_016382 [Dendrobium thyrsiflorum]|uniref:Uncharacterized protein n=1 Tax=Dendrobium thyrsiflorum TaxID=117978 RepID=A0ABD0URW9_DENTH
MASGKRSHALIGSSSRNDVDPRFTEATDAVAYTRYKSAWITTSKVVNPNVLTYNVLYLFVNITLGFILTLAFPFNSELLFKFFASLCINSTFITLQSYVNKCLVEITYQDLYEFLHLSTTRDKLHILASDPDFNCSSVNTRLRETNVPFHDSAASSLMKDVRTIQHILRTSVIPKAGNRIHITPILSHYLLHHG